MNISKIINDKLNKGLKKGSEKINCQSFGSCGYPMLVKAKGVEDPFVIEKHKGYDENGKELITLCLDRLGKEVDKDSFEILQYIV